MIFSSISSATSSPSAACIINDHINGDTNIFDIDTIKAGLSSPIYVAFEIYDESSELSMAYDTGYMVMSCEYKCSIAFVDGFVFIQANHILNESLVKMILYFIYNQIEVLLEGCNHQYISNLNQILTDKTIVFKLPEI